MTKYWIILAILFVGGCALPTYHDDSRDLEDMSIFFDHTRTGAEGRIVGGSLAGEGAYPWMVAMTTGINQAFRCGGSVISSKHVLTAAHCIPVFSVGNISIMSPTTRVRVGTNIWNSGGQNIRIQDFRIHPDYDWFFIQSDIGILITGEEIVMNSRVTPIALHSKYIPGNVPVRVSGWGRIKAGGPMSDQLLELRKHTVDNPRCKKEVEEKSKELDIYVIPVDPVTHICAFNALNQGVCNGDSGSPLVLDNNEQVGIVSWGLPCAHGVPDMFVRLSTYIDWVKSVTETA